MKDEHKYFFFPFKVGDATDKGVIDDLYFLTFGHGATAWKSYEPEGKGVLMAKIGTKAYAIGDLNKTETS